VARFAVLVEEADVVVCVAGLRAVIYLGDLIDLALEGCVTRDVADGLALQVDGASVS
jgi:hypothetical protein